MRTLLVLLALVALSDTAAAAPDTLEKRAADLALSAACGDADECRALRGAEAVAVARAIMSECSEEMPDEACLTLVATLAESKMHAYPTCSSDRCRKRCGTESKGKQRKCRIVCEARRGERAVMRSMSCNDGGTSFGWFQMKSRLTKFCQTKQRVDWVDPHDIRGASRCYAWIVARSYKKNACRIKNPRHRWAVSFARVAAGPTTRATLVDGTTIRVKRCRPHSYARRAMEKVPDAQAVEPLKGPRAVNPVEQRLALP